jgi:hypothetical protein
MSAIPLGRGPGARLSSKTRPSRAAAARCASLRPRAQGEFLCQVRQPATKRHRTEVGQDDWRPPKPAQAVRQYTEDNDLTPWHSVPAALCPILFPAFAQIKIRVRSVVTTCLRFFGIGFIIVFIIFWRLATEPQHLDVPLSRFAPRDGRLCGDKSGMVTGRKIDRASRGSENWKRVASLDGSPPIPLGLRSRADKAVAETGSVA